MSLKTKTTYIKPLLSPHIITAVFMLVGFVAGALISLHLRHTVLAGAASDAGSGNQLALGAEEAPERKNIYREGGCGCPTCCAIF